MVRLGGYGHLNKKPINVLIAAASCLAGCGGGGGGTPEPEAAGSPRPPVEPASPPAVIRQFVDATASSGIDFHLGYTGFQPNPDVERIATGGVAAGDYDNDGDVDLFVTRGDIGQNFLYRNNGSGVFTDVAAAAGVAFTATETENYRSSGPTFADMDGDGDLDLFIGSLFGDPCFIYQNSGAGGNYTFTDVTAGSGIDTLDRAQNMSSAFGDYDLDGYVDLFVTHWGTGVDLDDPASTQHLWRNESSNGTIRFTNVSESAGISPSIVTLPDPFRLRGNADWTFAASFARIDGDLYPDIVVAADFNNSQVFLNRGDGTFENATNVYVIIDYNGMGSALGDYDNDGDLDWFVSAIGVGDGQPVGDIGTLGNRLYRNTLGESAADGIFADITDAAGVADGGWGWGACFLDIDNDGNLDIYHTNGWPGPFSDDTSRAFVSNGAGEFEDQAAELGLDDMEQGRGIVCADFDNDGDTDILQLHREYPLSVTLWRNNADANNYLAVKLKGQPPNTDASGARIYATIGAKRQMREIIIGSNFLSQNPTIQVIGLGSASEVDALRIEWPDGDETILGPVAAGQTLELEQPLP